MAERREGDFKGGFLLSRIDDEKRFPGQTMLSSDYLPGPAVSQCLQRKGGLLYFLTSES